MSDDKLDRLESKIDKVVDSIGTINVTLAAQNVTLIEHVRRTNLLELSIKPIERHVTIVQGIGRFFLYVSAMGAGIEGIMILIRGLK